MIDEIGLIRVTLRNVLKHADDNVAILDLDFAEELYETLVKLKHVKVDDDRIQIVKERADVYVIDTAQGFIIDVYDKTNTLITTDTHWDDDFQGDY